MGFTVQSWLSVTYDFWKRWLSFWSLHTASRCRQSEAWGGDQQALISKARFEEAHRREEAWREEDGGEELGSDGHNLQLHCENDGLPFGRCGNHETWHSPQYYVLCHYITQKLEISVQHTHIHTISALHPVKRSKTETRLVIILQPLPFMQASLAVISKLTG